MRYYPVSLDIKGRNCLVVGGGKVAERKVSRLLECGAKVKLVAERLTEHLGALVKEGQVSLVGKDFAPLQFHGCFLVIGATGDDELNQKIGEAAMRAGLLCNIVDAPDKCSFILPSVVSRGDLNITISTAGKSPALAKQIREELEMRYGEEYGPFLVLMGKVRDRVLAESKDSAANKEKFEKLVHSPLVTYLRQGNALAVNNLLKQVLGDGFSLESLGFEVGKAD